MTFTEDDLIFPSKKIYENIKKINNTISLLYTQAPGFEECKLVNCSEMRNSKNKFNKALDEIENSINTIKKVKIKQIEPYSFINKFPAIFEFFLEASALGIINKTPIQERFYNLSKRLVKLLDIYPKLT